MIPTAQLTDKWTEVRVETHSTPYPARYGCPAGVEHSTAVYSRRIYKGRVYESVRVFVGECEGHRHTLVSSREDHIGIAADLIAEEEAAEQSARRAVIILPPRPQRPVKGQNKSVKTGRAARTRVGTFNSPERRRDVLTRLTVRVNAAAGVLTVADALRDHGADADLVRRYASPVGRKMAAAHRAATDAEPEQIGLAVAGRRLVWASGYRPSERAMLNAVIEGYEMRDPAAPKTGKAPRVRLLDVIAQRTEAAAPAEAQQPAQPSLVAELAQRHALPVEQVAERVEAIAAGMSGNPVLFDPQTGLTERGAKVVRALVAAEQTEAPPVAEPGARVALYVSDRADRVTGTVRLVERDAIGQDVAEIALPDGEVTHQAVRFLVAA